MSISRKTLYMTHHITWSVWQPATAFLLARLSIWDSSGLTSRPGTPKPEFLNANLWLIHLIAFDTDWSWNNFTCTIFAHCSLRSTSTTKKWLHRTSNLGQIFEIKLWMFGQSQSRWLFTKANCPKNLQIENRSLSCQRWSLHCFQTATDLAANFGCC